MQRELQLLVFQRCRASEQSGPSRLDRAEATVAVLNWFVSMRLPKKAELASFLPELPASFMASE